MPLPKFTALVAYDDNGVIGNKGELPWNCPEDLLHFKNTTMGNVVVMGYNTYAAMPKGAFDGRDAFVLTKRHEIDPKLATAVHSLRELSRVLTADHLKKELFVIGGEEIFSLFFDNGLIDRALVSHIPGVHTGDRHFPRQHMMHWDQFVLGEQESFTLLEYVHPERETKT